MPITFTCSHCQSRMSVPDQMAGKRGKCSRCKGAVIVPAGTTNGEPAAAAPAAGPVDLEAAAAAAFADEALEEKAAEKIEFTCPQCDEPVALAVDLGGKKHPCPHCRRIISVPMPRVGERKNWRDAGPKLPSAARRDEAPAPEGAWGSTQTRGPSAETLKEVGLIPEKHKPLTLTQKLRPFLLLGLVVLLVGGGWLVVSQVMNQGRQQKALEQALALADSDKGAEKVGGQPGQAVLSAYAGRYYLRGNNASKAREEFSKVVARLDQARRIVTRQGGEPSPEWDALLVETAPAVVKLSGTRDQVESDVRRPPAEVQKVLLATLAGIRDHEGRLEGLRRVAADMTAQGEAERVVPLTMQAFASADADQAEALAVAGLELFRAGKKDEAGKAHDEAVKVSGKGERPDVRSAVVALSFALRGSSPDPGKKGGPEAQERYLIGKAAGLAWKENVNGARAEVQNSPNADGRFRALLEIADQTGKAEDVEASLTELSKVQTKTRLAWSIVRLIRMGQKAGVSAERLEQAAGFLPPPLLGWGQFHLLRGRLKSSRAVEPADMLDKVPAGSVAQQAARVELSWHNTYQDRSWERTVAGWEEGPRAFGSLGVALGMQGGR
jgi:hypothetical protein